MVAHEAGVKAGLHSKTQKSPRVMVGLQPYFFHFCNYQSILPGCRNIWGPFLIPKYCYCFCVCVCTRGSLWVWLCMHIYTHALCAPEINLWNCPLRWPPTLIFEARSLTLGLADSAWLASKPRKTSGFFLPALENQSRRSLKSLATSQCQQEAESDGCMLDYFLLPGSQFRQWH